MDTLQSALLALLIGAVLGGSLVLSIVAAYRARDRAQERATPDVPGGVRDVLAGLDDSVVLVDTSGTVVAGSPGAADYGLADGMVLGTGELAMLVAAGRAGTMTAPATTTMLRGGEQRALSVRARAITARLVLVVLRDVTEQERVERLRRDFVANTGHELKTPIGAIGLLAEAVEAAADDPPQVRAFAQRLQGEAARLAALTARLMTLSHLQSEEPSPVAPVAVDSLIGTVIDAHTAQASAAGVHLRLGGERGAWVQGDAEGLGEAVGNLVANAIAYSPAGAHVGIGVRTAAGVVEISVADRGIGIAEGDLERIFERFYRADQARSRRTGGTGLGLSIAKHAVARHGGEVRVWSRLGHGSTFTIRLAAAAPPAPEQSRVAAKKKSRKTPDRAPRKDPAA